MSDPGGQAESGEESGLTWDDAMAAWEAGTPVELIRPPDRSITVSYRRENGLVVATSPELTGFEVTGRDLDEARGRAARVLAGYLDPAVKVREVMPPPEPASPAGL